MTDASFLLRSATRRAKSDVANKLISMFLHELSRKICREWGLRVDGQEYMELVRLRFGNRCPYCERDLAETVPVIEHLDGMNRYRTGLHIPGNVLVSCKKCNNEKRRDDGRKVLVLAKSGWASFLSHDGDRCPPPCATCRYWASVWGDETERRLKMSANLQKIRAFRQEFQKFDLIMASLEGSLPEALSKLYSDCQEFAQAEISSLLERF
ncbi:MAG TPA: hypothetical protein VII58_08565 [Acidobacteriaceae bacterium]